MRPSLSTFSCLKPEIIGHSIPIAGLLGDQQAALFGHAGFAQGSAKVTWGTGAFLMSNTGNQIVKSKCRLLTTVFYSSDRVANYALEGAIFIAGAGI